MSCLHGMQAEWCALCLGQVRATTGTSRGLKLKPRRASNPKLIDLLKAIGAKPHRSDGAGYYGIYFHTVHAEAVQALTDSPVYTMTVGFSEISCKDVYQDLFEVVV